MLTDHLLKRLNHLREGRSYANYENVREHVMRMKERDLDGSGQPSRYWREELENIEYILDASPLIVDRLRQHTYHVTGVWAYNYRTHKDRSRDQHRRKLDALFDAGGRKLFVPESPLLGGFGFEFDEGLVNLDTLKFFEVLIALDKGAVLDDFREAGERKVVWEIGAGWGGFPYQFKMLFPNTTYIISDLPELFLFSATYLMTLFPDARFLFYPWAEDTGPSWLDVDFVFVPHFATAAVTPPHVDLAVNMVSFQEMTTEQVDGYVDHAARLEAPFLYSLNRERSLYNPELAGVTGSISRNYWPHEVDVLPVSYTRWLDERSSKIDRRKLLKLRAAAEGVGKESQDYKHLVGWRRLMP